MTEERVRAAVATALEAAQGTQGLCYAGCKITSLHTGLWVGDDADDTDARVSSNADLIGIVADAFAK
jgi:hypothetical protein